PEDGAAPPALTPREPRFDLTVNNAPVRQVLLGLVEGTPYSILLHPETNGAVTLHLKGVSVPEAMEAIRQVYGHDYRRDGNRFSMLGRGMQTRLFPVNYLNFERRGQSDTRIVTGELTQSGANAGSSAGAPATGSGQAPAARLQGGVRVETNTKVEFWKDLRESLVAIIGAVNGRHVIVNPQAGVVLVRAMPDELRMVEEYLGVTQSTINRQVILEAKILEVELNDGFQTGINWAAVRSNTTFGMTGGGTIFNGSGRSDIAGNLGNLNPGGSYSAISGTNASAFGGVFSAAIKNADFASFLELLQSQGNVHVLSSPRVSTVNNQKAVIKVGGDEFFVTSVSGGTPASVGIAATMPTINLTPFFSGIALDVTPQIDDAQNIILHIHPAVSEVTQNNKTFKVADQDFTLPLAASAIQESDSVVRAANGQVIVIGGLMKEGSTDQNAGIPILGDIPIFGNAFKHKRVTRIKKELVILLKPTIVDHSQVWESAIKDSQTRLGGLKR
ncbi:MAG: pilus (MSHA type) biogenesis protein MshL, partial [Gammaproteobacteria bacterium]|nr:pilus (MSHA type) biogenesis protein MshL [Gammaproteobacteria bacterium]